MAVGRRFEDGDEEETTPVAVQRDFSRCMPCLGTGRLRLLGVELYETHRPCPYCRGAGTRGLVVRGPKEVKLVEEMKFLDVGRCKGAFFPGKRAPFGRVICLVCRGRFKPLQGLRVPNHVAVRSAGPKDGP